MIGELIGSKVPSCGVMFTEETEGGISMREERDKHGKIKTTGITIIQAGFGHNELVVNSRGSVDSYVAHQVDGKSVFYPVIREKLVRLVPAAEGLREERNTSILSLSPALEYKELVTLKLFADALEEFYGYRMDVEFVVRDAVIWLLQARPIVHNASLKSRRPTFIKNIKEFGSAVLKGRSIVGFGGSVVEIVSPKASIIKPQIGAALDEYLYHRDRGDVHAVLSGTDAPSISHEATTFRSEGKPVLYLPDYARLEDALAAGKQFIVSPQQHCVVILGEGIAPVVAEGWSAYPLPRELSCNGQILRLKKDRRLKAFLAREDIRSVSVASAAAAGESPAKKGRH